MNTKTKIYRLPLLGILVLIMVCAFNCNSSITKTSSAGNKFFPLGEGNYWKYINEAPRDESVIYNVSVKDVKKTDAGIQFTMSSFPYMTKENKEQILIQKTNGDVETSEYFSSTGVFTPSADKFKKGYEWNFGIFGAFVNDEKLKIVTEAGTFDDCYYVLLTDGFTFAFEFWYKKEIGIVKWGANRTNPPTIKPEYFVLKEYNIN